MTTRRQRQAEAESRRKELVEQLERDRERVKKASEQVREFGEACREIVPEFVDGESMSAEEFSAYLAALQWPPSTIKPQSVPEIELTGEASSEATEILNEAAEDEMVEKIVDEIIEETTGDADKATPSGDGWE